MVRAIGSTPDDPRSLIYLTLISAISKSERHIYLTNAYFVPDPQLLNALTDAARRGVDVRLLLPGRSDAGLAFHAGRSHYSALLRAGVKVHERRGTMLHAKTATIDGVWSTVGSTNLDWRSFLHNEESTPRSSGGSLPPRCRPPLSPTSKPRKPWTSSAGKREPSISG
jgi:cardiolipin synthase